MAIRKLINLSGKGDEWKRKLWNMSTSMLSSPYNSSPAQMSKALISSFTNHSNPAINQNRHFHSNKRKRGLSHEKQKKVTEDKMIAMRRSNLLGNLHQLSSIYDEHSRNQLHHDIPSSSSLEGHSVHNRDLTDIISSVSSSDGYFCSHLVADILIQLGVLSDHRDPNLYIPADFTSTCLLHSLECMKRWHFTPDLVIRNPSKAIMTESSQSSSSGVTISKDLSSSRSQTLHFDDHDLLPIEVLSRLYDGWDNIVDISVQKSKTSFTRTKSCQYSNYLRLSNASDLRATIGPMEHTQKASLDLAIACDILKSKHQSKSIQLRCIDRLNIGETLSNNVLHSIRFDQSNSYLKSSSKLSLHLSIKESNKDNTPVKQGNQSVQISNSIDYPSIDLLFRRLIDHRHHSGIDHDHSNHNKSPSMNHEKEGRSHNIQGKVYHLRSSQVFTDLFPNNFFHENVIFLIEGEISSTSSSNFSMKDSHKLYRRSSGGGIPCLINPEILVGMRSHLKSEFLRAESDSTIVAFPRYIP